MTDFVQKKAGLFVLFFILLGMSASASSPDSLRTRWINGKKYTLHKVVPKETFSSVSRKYNVSVEEIQNANPGVDGLKIGQIINVPASSGTAITPDTERKESSGKTAPSAIVTTPKKASTPASASGQKTHTVAKGETLYRISKMYAMTVDELKAMNGLTGNEISLGQKLKVSGNNGESNVVETEAVKTSPVKTKPALESKPLTESKNASDSKSTVEEKPTPADVKPIVVSPVSDGTGKEKVKDSPKEAAPGTVNEIASENTTPVKTESPAVSKTVESGELPAVYSNPGTSRTSVIEKDPQSGTELEKITEVGVAAWMSESDLNQSKFYALHRTAPVGTIIKLTNRMNNNSVFVKVVGTLPDTGDNNGYIIKITQAAAQRIGALDQKFTAELSYGISK